MYSNSSRAVYIFSCVADMLYETKYFGIIGLQVEQAMVFMMDNKGAVDLFNVWSVSGSTRQISTRIWGIREIKEHGLLSIKWLSI